MHVQIIKLKFYETLQLGVEEGGLGSTIFIVSSKIPFFRLILIFFKAEY